MLFSILKFTPHLEIFSNCASRFTAPHSMQVALLLLPICVHFSGAFTHKPVNIFHNKPVLQENQHWWEELFHFF